MTKVSSEDTEEAAEPEGDVAATEAQGPAPIPIPAEPGSEIRPPGKPMLDIQANIDVEVVDVTTAATKLRQAMLSQGAQVAQDSMSRSGGSERATFTFRVPAQTTGQALEAIERLGVVHQKDVVANDVSKEYYDAELRLENLRRTLARYTELLARTSDVDELLRIEAELDRLRGEIEMIKGTLRFLRDRVSQSTVVVTLWAQGSIPEDVIHPEAALYPGVRLGWVFDGGPDQPSSGFGSAGLSLRFAQRSSVDLDLLRSFEEDARDVEAFWATIGGDTYSEFLGNGQRRYLNPYLGLRIGYGNRLPGHEFVAGVTAGLELLKTEVFTLEADLRALGLFSDVAGTRLGLQPSLGANVAF